MSDPHRPITSSRRLSSPENYRIYSTRREVANAKTFPSIGDAMTAELGLAFASHLILDVSESPREGKVILNIEHGPVPANYTEYESYPYTFPPVYPRPAASVYTFFPGGSESRSRMVVAKVEYEFTATPGTVATWRALAATATDTSAPLEIESYMAKWAAQEYEQSDGSYSTVGRWLNSTFIGQNTLNDAYPISITGELAVVIPASVPSATTYAGWVSDKTEFIAERTIQKWRGPIYMKRTVKLIAQ